MTTEYVWLALGSPTRTELAWMVVGFIGQALFFGRFFVQWLASERKKASVVPPQFWYFWIGVLLIVVVMFLPNGILGGLAKLTAKWRGAS